MGRANLPGVRVNLAGVGGGDYLRGKEWLRMWTNSLVVPIFTAGCLMNLIFTADYANVFIRAHPWHPWFHWRCCGGSAASRQYVRSNQYAKKQSRRPHF